MVKKLKQIYQLYQQNRYCYQLPKLGRYVQYFFIGFGVCSFVMLLLLYLWGYHVTQRFDEQFPRTFRQFVQTSFAEDVPNALIVKYPLAKGIDLEQAEKSLLAAAKQNQLELINTEVLDKYLSTEQMKWQLKAFLILPVSASQSLLHQHPHFAAHLPFRVVLYKDFKGQPWIAMPNLPLLLHGLKHRAKSYQMDAITAYDALFKTVMASVYGIEEQN